MKANYDSVLGQITENERKMLNKEKLIEIRRRIDDLSGRWSALQVNQFMTLQWSLK
jgi:hypothetical protein